MKISDFSLIGRLLIWSVISFNYALTADPTMLLHEVWNKILFLMKHMDYRGGNNEVSL